MDGPKTLSEISNPLHTQEVGPKVEHRNKFYLLYRKQTYVPQLRAESDSLIPKPFQFQLAPNLPTRLYSQVVTEPPFRKSCSKMLCLVQTFCKRCQATVTLLLLLTKGPQSAENKAKLWKTHVIARLRYPCEAYNNLPLNHYNHLVIPGYRHVPLILLIGCRPSPVHCCNMTLMGLSNPPGPICLLHVMLYEVSVDTQVDDD